MRLQGETLILVGREFASTVYDETLAGCAKAGFSPTRLREVPHAHAVVSLVAAGCGVSILPMSAARVGIPEAVCRPVQGVALVTRVAVLWPRVGASRAARDLAQVARTLANFPGTS